MTLGGFKPRWWLLTACAAGLAAWLAVGLAAWLATGVIDQWRSWRWHIKVDERNAQSRQERDAWLKANPGKLYSEWLGQPFFAAKMPQPVRDVWFDVVLLESGVVLLPEDLLRLQLNPNAALPAAPPGPPKLLTLSSRHATALWSDGTLRADFDSPGKVWYQVQDPVTRQWRHPYDRLRPRTDKDVPPHNLHDAVAVAASAWQSFMLVLRSNGQVHAFGPSNDFGELGPQRAGPDGVPGFVLDDAVAIAAGERHGLALRKDGTVWMWGQDDLPYVHLKLPPEAFQPAVRKVELPARALKIVAGARTSFALLADGTVWGWGSANCAALGVLASALPKEAYSGPGIAYRVLDYPPVPNRMLKPRRIEGPADIVDLGAGYNHGIALSRDGTVWAWGENNFGQGGRKEVPQPRYTEGCATGSGKPQMFTLDFPHRMQGVSDVKQIFASATATALIKNDDTLWIVGKGCYLCDTSALLNHHIESWGRVAAKAMWCGKVDEVKALRKAVDGFVEATFPRVRDKSLLGFFGRDIFEGRRTDLNLRFRRVATNDYVKGYDDDTSAIRKRAGNPEGFAFPPPSTQADIWWKALDLDREGMSNDADARGRRLTAFIRPEDDVAYRGKHCSAGGDAFKTAMSEVARETAAAKNK